MLEVAIGMIMVYLMVSLVCTAANEALASALSWRAHNLKEGIRNLLDGDRTKTEGTRNPLDRDPTKTEGIGSPLYREPSQDTAGASWTQQLYDHPLIKGLYKKGNGPSYIPSRTFALALTDLVLPKELTTGASTATADQLRTAVGASPAPDHIKQVFRLMINEAERSSVTGKMLQLQGVVDLQKLDTLLNQTHQHIEIWFNQSMERVSGWYKRKIQAVTITIAAIVTVGLNVDSVSIAQRLARDSTLRSAIVSQAERMVQQPPPSVVVNTTPPAPQTVEGAPPVVPPAPPTSPVQDTSASVKELKNTIAELNALGLPLGWPDQGDRSGPSWFFLKLMGLLLTAGAASLGAPFWFDVLNKFMSVRAAGKAPEEAPKSPKQIPVPAPPGRPEGAAAPPDADKDK
jgi:hypothetical protein